MMELTLTGASLNEDRIPDSANNPDRNASSASASAAAAVATAGETTKKKKECQHSCCDDHNHAAASEQSYRPINLEEMIVKNPSQLFKVMLNILKGGQYTAFAHIANVILDHEKSTGKQPLENMGGTPPTSNYTGTSLGMYMEDGHSLVHWAAKRADDIRFMEFFSKLPNVNLHLVSTDSVGMRPLHWAATEGSIPIVALLLKTLESSSSSILHDEDNDHQSTTTEKKKKKPSSSLMMESSEVSNSNSNSKSREMIMNARDKSGCTPLLIAAQYGHADLAAFLIRKGADPNAVDDSRDTALHWAAYKGSVAVCGLLLHLNGVDAQLSSKDTFGQTPLHLASIRGNAEVVRYLLEEAEMYNPTHDSNSNHSTSNKDKPTTETPASRVGSKSLANLKLDTSNTSGTGSGVNTLPKVLLTMCDREGKTPLDLAIKKKKLSVELILKENMEKHCHDNSSRNIVRYCLKKTFNLKNWRVWFGLAPGVEANPPKVIFWFVILCQLIGTVFLEYYVFLPIFSFANNNGNNNNEGRLWDCTTLNILRSTLSILMWISFLLCHETQPGILNNNTNNNSEPNKQHPQQQQRRQLTWCCNDNQQIQTNMEILTLELKKLYEQTLDSYANVDSNNKTATARLPLCHTCHIAKPLRSKHCKVKNKCILLFDHHCPFVGTTIGLYNYRFFLSYLLSMTLLLITFIITWVTFLRRGDKMQWGWLTLFVALSLFLLMVSGLLYYHAGLVSKNLTTNEHMNVWRYTYLRDEFGRFFNPFDKGWFGNLVSKLFPGPDSYILPGRYSVSESFTNNDTPSHHHKHKNEDEEKQELIEHFA